MSSATIKRIKQLLTTQSSPAGQPLALGELTEPPPTEPGSSDSSDSSESSSSSSSSYQPPGPDHESVPCVDNEDCCEESGDGSQVSGEPMAKTSSGETTGASEAGTCCPDTSGNDDGPGNHTKPSPGFKPGWPGHGQARTANPGFSGFPIRYKNGEVRLVVKDLSSDGFGRGWGHTRSYSNRLTDQAAGLNGNSWFIKQQPLAIVVEGSLGEETPARIVIMGIVSDAKWFDWQSGQYVGKFGIKETLFHDEDNDEFILCSPRGRKTVFYDFTTDPALAGRFKRFEDPKGNLRTAQYDTETGQLTSVVQSYEVGEATVTETYSYAYVADGLNAGQLQSVTLGIDRGAGSVSVRKAEYTYYDGETEPESGTLNDLRTAIVSTWDGSAWQAIRRSYYRYYTEGEPNGFTHGLKFVVGAEAWQRMETATPNELDPVTATDEELRDYADHFFEYDTDKQVTLEEVHGGSLNYSYEYAGPSSHADGYNNWKHQTTENLPNGCQQIVYTNYAGQVILKVYCAPEDSSSSSSSAGPEEWYEYYHYTEDGPNTIGGRVDLHANSSAVESYDENEAGLVTFKADAGFIRAYTYHAKDGEAPGYLHEEQVQQGGESDPITLRSFTYEAHTLGNHTIYPLLSETVYRCPSEAGATTSYSYEWFVNPASQETMQIKERTTQLPVVPDGNPANQGSDQHGSGEQDTRVERFNELGQLIWSKDERGIISGFQYDLVTGALKRRVLDADAGENPPWTPVSGSHLNLVTDYESDDLGRMVQELGPEHAVDINGTLTSIRRARWIVYVETETGSERWEASGYATRSGDGSSSSASSGTESEWDTFKLVNPVSITKFDQNGRVTDTIQAVRASEDGKLQPTDDFSGQITWTRWTKRQYSDQGQLEWERAYHLIPDSGVGAEDTNYGQTTYAYDSAGRLSTVTSPEGTITGYEYEPSGWLRYVKVGISTATMRVVEEHEYDDGEFRLDGNLTQVTRYENATETRVIRYHYDWQNRVHRMEGEENSGEEYEYCNFGTRLKSTGLDRSTTPETKLWCRKDLLDTRGRVYSRIAYPGADGATPTLVDDFWYDAAGHLIKQIKAGSRAFEKTQYDALGRPVARYLCYGLDELASPIYADAGSVDDNVVVRQEKMVYDAAGTMIQHATYERFHDAGETTGELVGPNE